MNDHAKAAIYIFTSVVSSLVYTAVVKYLILDDGLLSWLILAGILGVSASVFYILIKFIE